MCWRGLARRGGKEGEGRKEEGRKVKTVKGDSCVIEGGAPCHSLLGQSRSRIEQDKSDLVIGKVQRKEGKLRVNT